LLNKDEGSVTGKWMADSSGERNELGELL
jgi:hypothetical protein